MPDSVMGGAGSNPGRVIPKTLKNGTSGYLAWRSALIRQALASLLSKKITSMMGAPCNTLIMRYLEYLADSDSDSPQVIVRHEYGIFSMDLEVGYKVFFLMDSCR